MENAFIPGPGLVLLCKGKTSRSLVVPSHSVVPVTDFSRRNKGIEKEAK